MIDIVIDEAYHMIDNHCTIRECAKHFDRSKSMVHRDLRYKLKRLDPTLYRGVSNILEVNKHMRSVRGGQATKKRWEELKCCQNVE